MSESSNTEKPVPPWAWIFAVICGAIPVVSLGGAIPGALGAGGVIACILVAQQSEKPEAVKVLLCTGISVMCWGLFGGLMLLVLASTTDPKDSGSDRGRMSGSKSSSSEVVDPDGAAAGRVRVRMEAKNRAAAAKPVVMRTKARAAKATDLSDEAVRRKIYASATRMVPRIAKSEARREDYIAKDRSTVLVDKRIAHFKAMDESSRKFAVKHHKITPDQLVDIIEEGNAAGWSQD